MKTKIIQKLVAVVLIGSIGVTGVCTAFAADRDGKIEKAFKSSQAYRTQLMDADITVGSDAGVVTLKGEVENEKQKQIAEETARGISGVQRVENLLEIAKPPTDEWIATAVRGSLLMHKHVSLIDTQVEVKEAIVTLTGLAANDAEKALAAQYAADVKGVKQVENNIKVVASGDAPAKPDRSLSEKIDDATITARLKFALSVHRATSALRTEVKTENGVVTLQGEAKNPAEKVLVTKLAMNIAGVRDVRNEMVIKTSSS